MYPDSHLPTVEIDRRERVSADAQVAKRNEARISVAIGLLANDIKNTPPDSPFYDALEDLLGDLQSAQDGLTAHLQRIEGGRYQ